MCPVVGPSQTLHRLMTESKQNFNKTPWSSDDFVDLVGSRSRILMAQIRSLSKQENYITAMKKGTMFDKQAVDELLGNLEMEAEVPASSKAETCTALVPYTSPPEEAASPNKVFKRLLNKSFSSPTKEEAPALSLEEPSGSRSPPVKRKQLGALSGGMVFGPCSELRRFGC